ncbi:Cell cycle protein [Elusimicrobium minutum Pei191]|uniref:Cell cycle protein n=1 Tax=Elusimicrobium minutum (strain Pei191) TaxID=445932 RepID=B2KEI1_ELUMP|nr:FtsW/RodA/SpoVE family cell cycle protein [Elusimicrobium minutum]ACC98927.1 Cell cycle protein [Elusimicrobium minutum Pei191]
MLNQNSYGADQNIKRTRVDYFFIGAIFLLVLIGTICIMSAVADTDLSSVIVRKQLIALPLGLGAFLIGWFFNYQIYSEQWKWIYGFVLFLLIAVLIFGTYQRGSKSWFVFPFFSFQPSEICRVATLLIAAAFLERNARRIKEPIVMAGVFCLVAPIFLLIMKQPDFSSVVITLPALLALLYCAGVNLYYLVLICLFGFFAGIFPILWTYLQMYPELAQKSFLWATVGKMSTNYFYMAGFCAFVIAVCLGVWWTLKQLRMPVSAAVCLLAGAVIITGFLCGLIADKHIKPYQRKRVEVFLAPKSDPKGAGYNVLQAQIAMGSGGILGKGVFSGTQSRLGFVPEKHTDFILAVVGEELGLWGTLSVLGLFLVILWRIVFIAYCACDFYGYLVCSGIFSMFFIYCIVNFGMLIGLVPVAGIPLPLISYGGSNFVASMWALGIIHSVYSRRITFI